ncbi:MULTISPECIES: type-F conjugative transfer system protein TraW [Legionella]|uniref:type-F conjugative transfer system protein TraW n=1 Tax=Legionella TaxID=445 RepID=UPI0009666108|nr:type-F conjugative transfer system protein TraW [Legionella sp. 39-23]OJW06860.1 MAG: type-F conjugative transfer system protein TraW [Legionella sp. 39-23]
MIRFLFFSTFVFLSGGIEAKSLGRLGQTFPVIEKSLLTLIYERLNTFDQNGQLNAIENAWVKQVDEQVKRPRALGLVRTETTLTHYYTPVVTLEKNVVDQKGRVVLQRGMSVNALNQLPSYNPVWVFLNYDDLAQRAFAEQIRTHYPEIQWILTGGSVVDAERGINETIYFDQEARITKKLKIEHVPALVTRENDSLKIMEFRIGEDGHAF